MNAPAERIARPPWWEAGALTLQIAAAVVWWLASLDGLSLGWDTLNHHVYLGWMAVEGNRLASDVFAAGSMSCQFPYAYAPLYWLQRIGATGQQAALALALPALITVPAVWLLTWTLLPRSGWQNRLARWACTWLAFLSPLWWSLLDSTSNDVLSTLPMVWAYALVAWQAAVELEQTHFAPGSRSRAYWWVVAGALAALALTMKISQAFAGLGLGVLAAGTAVHFSGLIRRTVWMVLGATLVGALVWWPWARGVWLDCGSPIYPMWTDTLRPWASRLP